MRHRDREPCWLMDRYYAAHYYLQLGKQSDAVAVLKAGVEACADRVNSHSTFWVALIISFLLTFALTENLEEQHSLLEAHTSFENLINRLGADIDATQVLIEAEINTARGPEILNNASVDDIEGQNAVVRLVEEREARGALVEETRSKDLDELKVGLNIAWIMYMRFSRRAEVCA